MVPSLFIYYIYCTVHVFFTVHGIFRVQSLCHFWLGHNVDVGWRDAGCWMLDVGCTMHVATSDFEKIVPLSCFSLSTKAFGRSTKIHFKKEVLVLMHLIIYLLLSSLNNLYWIQLIASTIHLSDYYQLSTWSSHQ